MNINLDYWFCNEKWRYKDILSKFTELPTRLQRSFQRKAIPIHSEGAWVNVARQQLPRISDI